MAARLEATLATDTNAGDLVRGLIVFLQPIMGALHDEENFDEYAIPAKK